MVSSGPFRRVLASLGVLIWMLTLTAETAFAQDTDCTVTVNPRAAVGGSVFVFSGSGYIPSKLILQKEGDDPINHDLNVGESDPWEVTVRSRVGDEGTWSASFEDASKPCTASTEFRVTLSNTDAISDAVNAARSGSLPIELYAGVIVVGFGGGLFIGRLMRDRRLA
jgi:hypothetical protein